MSDLMRLDYLTGYPLETSMMTTREEYAYRKASHLYRTMRAFAILQRVWDRLRHKTHPMLVFPEVYEVLDTRDLGDQTVEIDKIKGSERRNDDYDESFRPLKIDNDHWVWAAMQAWLGYGMPSVELIDVEGKYYVREGHMRVSVMRALGCKYVFAHIIDMETSFCSKRLPQPARRPALGYSIISL